jgi:hypothetical protein
MSKDKSGKEKKQHKFLEYLVDMWVWGLRLTEEEEILKKRRLERSKSQLEKEQEQAK